MGDVRRWDRRVEIDCDIEVVRGEQIASVGCTGRRPFLLLFSCVLLVVLAFGVFGSFTNFGVPFSRLLKRFQLLRGEFVGTAVLFGDERRRAFAPRERIIGLQFILLGVL